MPPKPRRQQQLQKGDKKKSPAGDGSIVFFHPDLGIGGAERLVVDAAVALQQREHRVVIFTNHCNKSHCFEECRDGTLDVRVRGSWLFPVKFYSRFAVLLALLRHIHLLLQITLLGELYRLKPRAFHVDQISGGLPLLRYLWPSVPVLFYCHFPDMLLAQGRGSLFKRLYRAPFDWLEEWSMGFAHAVAVNSNFTLGIVDRTWPGLKRKVKARVVYPCVDTEADGGDVEEVLRGEKVILSINRFEEKKNIALAIKAFGAIPASERKGARLVIAGGYDLRVSENYNYHKDLEKLADSLDLGHATMKPISDTEAGRFAPTFASSISDVPSAAEAPVLFCLSIPGTLKTSLLHSSRLLAYTPSNEHFGIVPLEAMLAGRPVLAANTGGPVETVVDGRTGWLRDPEDVKAWTTVMRRVLGMSEGEVAAMGAAGEKRVRNEFGRHRLAGRLEIILDEIAKLQPGRGFVTVLINLVVLALAGWLGMHAMREGDRLRQDEEWKQGWRRSWKGFLNWLM